MRQSTESIIEQRFRLPQFIHRSGKYIAQILEDGEGVLFEKNRFFTSKYAGIRDMGDGIRARG